jgi:GntR family transcriptional regulator
MLCIFIMYRYKANNLTVAVSATSPDPMYKQVTDQIRDAIAAGSLAAGARLPSIRELAGAAGISHITVKRAYADLERDGYVVTRQGLGSFVAGISRERMKAQKLEDLRREIAKLARAARSFGIPVAEIGRIVDELKIKGK